MSELKHRNELQETLESLAPNLTDHQIQRLHEAITTYVDDSIAAAVRDLDDKFNQRGVHSPDY